MSQAQQLLKYRKREVDPPLSVGHKNEEAPQYLGYGNCYSESDVLSTFCDGTTRDYDVYSSDRCGIEEQTSMQLTPRELRQLLTASVQQADPMRLRDRNDSKNWDIEQQR
ncbi:hypothetical protein Trydic_g3262 [Trypoxylus dichotomus]